MSSLPKNKQQSICIFPSLFIKRRNGVPVGFIPPVTKSSDVYDVGMLFAAQLVQVGDDLSGIIVFL